MFNSKAIIFILIFTIGTISLGYFSSPVDAAEAIVTSTSTPPPTTTTPTPTTPPPTTPPPNTQTPTVTPTPCPEKLGCAGIVPTVTPTTSNSILLFAIGIVLLFVYWVINIATNSSNQD